MDQSTPQDPAQNQATTGQQGQGTTIPPIVLEKYPDLVELIKKTESMSDEERAYWFQILPIMTEEQVARLRQILNEEKTQLAKLDQEYQGQLQKLNQKHLNEWNNFEKKQEREDRKKAEDANRAQEQAEEAALLQQLEDTDSK